MFANGSVVSVFEKRPLVNNNDKEYGYACRITSSYAQKDKDGQFVTGEDGKRVYVQDFGGWVRFVGKAYPVMKDVEVALNKPARVKIDSCGVSSYAKTDEVGNRTYHNNFLVFDASIPENIQKDAHKDSDVAEDAPLPF